MIWGTLGLQIPLNSKQKMWNPYMDYNNKYKYLEAANYKHYYKH